MGVSTGVSTSWGIRGVFVEYSWDIRMYRVCVGYVSGMYREYIETNKKNIGSTCIYESFIVTLQQNYVGFHVADGLANGDISCGFVPETQPDRSAYGWARDTFALSVRMGEDGDERRE